MQVLLMAATEMEIAPFIHKNPHADILITGVGAAPAVYSLVKRLHQFDYDLVIQAGIAGTYQEVIQLGDVVMVSEDCFADLGVIEKGHFQPIHRVGLANKDAFPFSDGWLKNNNPLIKDGHYKKVRAITVNMVTDDQSMIRHFTKAYAPDIESMEGAALHYVCLQENIPFIQIRSISNMVGERDKTKWQMKEAIENLYEALDVLLSEGLKKTGNK